MQRRLVQGYTKKSCSYIVDTVTTNIAWLVVVVDIAVLNKELINKV
jgi:hypothetical protein